MIIPIESRDHWLSLRAGNVGASEVAALFGCQPDYAMSHWTLWQVKAGRMADPFKGNERTKWGLRLEEVIAAAASEEIDYISKPVSRCGYAQHPTVKGFGASPDFVITGDDDPGLLETKNVDWMIHKRTWGDEPPMHILLQLQAQLACAGLKWGVVAALVGGNTLKHWRFDARPKLIAEIERRVTDFWASIDRGEEPPLDGSKSTYEAVKTMLPAGGDNSAIEIGDVEFSKICDAINKAKAIKREQEAAIRLSEEKIMKMMNGASRAYGMGWSASLIHVAEKPELMVTEDMVGKALPGRKGSVRLQIKEMDL